MARTVSDKYIALFHMKVITYPCRNPEHGLVIFLSVNVCPGDKRDVIQTSWLDLSPANSTESMMAYCTDA